jgi:glycosyltransferase involved in cell wall biosynthesis
MAPALRLPISVSLIARNEADNLERCLRSVADWCAQIVVVTNDCSDNTAEIARRFGALVIENPWQDFQAQKNVSLDVCTQPWVLALDADEEIPAPLRTEIEQFFTANGDHTHFAGVEFPRRSWFLGRWITHGDWYPDRCLRLFRRDAGRWGGDPAHTHVIVNGSVARFKADMYHYSYPTLLTQVYKISRQSDDFVKTQTARGRRWSLIASLARPPWRFFRAYVLRLGFLDGYPGYYIACSTAFSTLLRYSRLYENQHEQKSPHA